MRKIWNVLGLMGLFCLYLIYGGLNTSVVLGAERNTEIKNVVVGGEMECTFSLEDNQICMASFTPKETGVYGLLLQRSEGDMSTTDSSIAIDKYLVSCSGRKESVAIALVMEKGRTYKIRMGFYITDSSVAKKGAGTLRIKKVDNRIQTLMLGKKLVFSYGKDGQIFDNGGPEDNFEEMKLYDKWFFRFKPKKTGYYRFYNIDTMDGLDYYNVINAKGYTGKNHAAFSIYGEEIIKLKKGQTYYICTDVTSPSSFQIKAEYIAKKRNLKLHGNYGKNSFTLSYVTKTGNKIGVLLNVATILQNHEMDGYKFLGWYTKKKGGRKIRSNSRLSGKTKILYAHWKKK